VLSPTTFTLYTQSQRVRISWANGSIPMWVDDCAITDALNWLCIYNDNSGMIGMLEGTYWRVSRPLEIQEPPASR
jgi:hypothetical protein